MNKSNTTLEIQLGEGRPIVLTGWKATLTLMAAMYVFAAITLVLLAILFGVEVTVVSGPE